MDGPGFESQHGQGRFLDLPACCLVVTEILSLGESVWGVKLTIHLHLVPELGMKGAIPPVPLCAVMECTLLCLFIFVQGDSVARGPKLLCVKNYVIEIMT